MAVTDQPPARCPGQLSIFKPEAVPKGGRGRPFEGDLARRKLGQERQGAPRGRQIPTMVGIC